jgi:shikimate kinase
MGKKTNITLIGMPASGKSSVGVVLAKRLGKKFVDTDIVIQEKYGKLLKELIEEHGDEGFREIEDEVNAGLDLDNSIISPGGSVVYGEKAMQHLKEISVIIYLELSYTAIKSRLGDLRERGITLKEGQSLKDLYLERVPLYEKYADITVNEMKKSLAKTIDEICERLGEKPKKRRNFKSKRVPFTPKDKQEKNPSHKSGTAKSIKDKIIKDKNTKDKNSKDKNFKDKNFKDRFSREKSDIANNNKAKTNNIQRKNIKKHFKKNEN